MTNKIIADLLNQIEDLHQMQLQCNKLARRYVEDDYMYSFYRRQAEQFSKYLSILTMKLHDYYNR